MASPPEQAGPYHDPPPPCEPVYRPAPGSRRCLRTSSPTRRPRPTGSRLQATGRFTRHARPRAVRPRISSCAWPGRSNRSDASVESLVRVPRAPGRPAARPAVGGRVPDDARPVRDRGGPGGREPGIGAPHSTRSWCSRTRSTSAIHRRPCTSRSLAASTTRPRARSSSDRWNRLGKRMTMMPA